MTDESKASLLATIANQRAKIEELRDEARAWHARADRLEAENRRLNLAEAVCKSIGAFILEGEYYDPTTNTAWHKWDNAPKPPDDR